MQGPGAFGVVSQVVIATGASGGLFIYDTSLPAFGHLIASNVPAAGTDTVGNAYLAGETSYLQRGNGTMIAVQLFNGQLSFLTAASAAGPYTAQATIVNDVSNQLNINSPSNISILSGLGAGLSLTNIVSTQTNIELGAGNIIEATDPNIGGNETDHAPSLQTHYITGSSSAGFQPVTFRLTSEGHVRINGIIHNDIGSPPNNMWVMPSGYIPDHATMGHARVPVTINNNAGTAQAGFVQIDDSAAATPGQVHIILPGLPNANEDVMFDCEYKLKPL